MKLKQLIKDSHSVIKIIIIKTCLWKMINSAFLTYSDKLCLFMMITELLHQVICYTLQNSSRVNNKIERICKEVTWWNKLNLIIRKLLIYSKKHYLMIKYRVFIILQTNFIFWFQLTRKKFMIRILTPFSVDGSCYGITI